MQARVDETEDLNFIIDLIYERSRIRLHEGKQQLIKARLGKRMRLHGFGSLHEYCDFLRRQTDDEEIGHVVDALTTNFTHFLREQEHFEFTVKQALPSLLPPGRQRFRIWSAACATGEEPYSIGFYLSEHFPPVAGWDWRITGTDISTKALKHGQAGIYRQDRLNGLSAEWQRKYFQRGVGDWEGHFRVKKQVMERVQFQQLNLLGDYRFNEQYEVIFCRNVMIYFDRPTQETLVNHLSQYLMPKGYLLVGHSESLIGLSIPLKCRKPSIYQKD